VRDQKTEHNPAFKAVLIYENFAVGVRAQRFFEDLVRGSDKTLEEQMWDFNMLGIREVRNAAASAARKADVVAVAFSGQLELTSTTQAWLEMWAWLLEDEEPALVALFDSSSEPEVARPLAHLSCIARRAGIDFFWAHSQVSLFAVLGIVGPHDDGIWPMSVERDVLARLSQRVRELTDQK
jgi:hypothetical protein